MAVSKKKIIKSLENLSEDLKDLIRTQYPAGYDASITRISNGKKEPLFVFPLETDDATYLGKVPVTKNSDGEYDMEKKTKGDLGDEEDFVPGGDDFGSDDTDTDEAEGDGFDDEGGGAKASGEASSDPDFDN